MGFQGQLSSVNLTDIFQTLHMNRQTGTLSVVSSADNLHLYFDGGQIVSCTAPLTTGQSFLLNALVRKSLLSHEQAERIYKNMLDSRLPLRQLLMSSNFISEPELDDICAWCIEELSCPIFEWQDGDFTFLDGPPIEALTTPEVIRMGRVGLSTTQLVLEATRRKDEWKRIREVITNNQALYVVDNEGRNNLRNVQTDPEMLKVLRYLDGRHTLDQIATEVGVTRFDTFAITSQLVLSGVARAQTPEEVVVDARTLRTAGDLELAKSLLENTITVANVPEVIRPLAEICAALKQAPRAVELYLELIQIAQDQGDLEQARADLDTVLSLSPDDPDLQFDRANVLSELGAVEDAANAYVAAAQAYLATRDTNRAIDACHRAKNLLPRSPDPHRFLAKAYLMDGQTENAVVEYKALWHALVSENRPRRALDILSNTLETDCRFNNIKEQVLSHAQNSEAIKTSKAMRFLAYVVVFLLLAGTCTMLVTYYQQVILSGRATDDISQFRTTLKEYEQAGRYEELFVDIKRLKTKYGGVSSQSKALNDLELSVRQDYEAAASRQQEDGQALLQSQHEQAVIVLNDVMKRFPGTPGAAKAKEAVKLDNENLAMQRARNALDAAKRRWDELDWDGAVAALQELTPEHAVPPALTSEVARLNGEWNAKLLSAKDLYERAEQLDNAGKTHEALAAFARASRGRGEQFVGLALKRQAQLELRIATETCIAIRQALEQGDDKRGFEMLETLKQQVQSASTKEVAAQIAQVELPFLITLTSPRVSLVVRRSGSNDQVLSAPAGTTGAWTQHVSYQIGETVTVEVRRPGFSTQTLSISVQAHQSHADVALMRGPLWSIDLKATGVCTPVAIGKTVLLANNHGAIDVIDELLGTSKPIAFPATVDEFKFPPVIYQNLAYVVLENRLHIIDTSTHAELWHYPSDDRDSPLQLTGSVWVEENELIPGQMLIFLGAKHGKVLTLALLGQGQFNSYKTIDLPGDLTGALVGDQFEPNHTILYAPCGNQLAAFDTTTSTAESPATQILNLHMRGELSGRLTRCVVGGRTALLGIDNTGTLIAIDNNPGIPDLKRPIATWALDGTGVGAVAGKEMAYVALAEGRVVGADLIHPGQVLWHAPDQGSFATLNQPPVIGRYGVYVIDAQGILHCLDGKTGKNRWQVDMGNQPTAGILARDGRIYIPLHGDTLACIEEGEE